MTVICRDEHIATVVNYVNWGLCCEYFVPCGGHNPDTRLFWEYTAKIKLKVAKPSLYIFRINMIFAWPTLWQSDQEGICDFA